MVIQPEDRPSYFCPALLSIDRDICKTMAHNRTARYSAPFKRNSLLGLHQYAASEFFPALGSWDRARMEDLYVVKGTVGRNQPVQITVVGVVSSDKAHLMPHGNYDPSYMPIESIAKKAKLQFVLSSPADDPDFASDYEISLDRLKAVQEDVAGSPTRREHFIEGGNMKMNFYLFSKKDAEDGPQPTSTGDETDAADSDVEDVKPPAAQTPAEEPYEVDSAYKYAWDVVGKTHDNNYMQVYGVDEQLVDYRLFPKLLTPGTTVLVTFTLKHFGIREKGTPKIISDTFTACVESVSILKEAEKKAKATPSSTPKRRPLPVSQLPIATRATLKLSSNTFSPVRVRTEPSFAAAYRASRRQPETSPEPLTTAHRDVSADIQRSGTASPGLSPPGLSPPGLSPLGLSPPSLSPPALAPITVPQNPTDQSNPYVEVIRKNYRERSPRTPSPTRSSSTTISTVSADSGDSTKETQVDKAASGTSVSNVSSSLGGVRGDASDASGHDNDIEPSGHIAVDVAAVKGADSNIGVEETEDGSYEIIDLVDSHVVAGGTMPGARSDKVVAAKGKGPAPQDKIRRRRG